MRNDVRTGIFIGVGLVFAGWILFALFSDTLQERRQKQLANEPVISEPVWRPAPTEKQITSKPSGQNQKAVVPTQPATAPATEQIHIVQGGQSLSSISSLYYETADNWQKILEANSDVLQNASQLRPGMRLKIPAK